MSAARPEPFKAGLGIRGIAAERNLGEILWETTVAKDEESWGA
jgi:hypothetical protein